MISITELAKLFHTTIRTIRYYEEIGLIDKAIRIKGRRYFNKEETVYKMNEIQFLKSLNFKLADIELIIKNSLYIKPLLMNVRLEFIQMEISRLTDEAIRLENQLRYYGWKPVEINDDNILKKMKKNYYELSCLEKNLSKKEQVTLIDSKMFIQFYKLWHERVGIKLSDDHIRIIAFNPNIILNKHVKKLFQTYCETTEKNVEK
ncbi:MerR family transcriptional regulator [Enterococcus durans]|uniref:MerR family transcriptional regulator n=1 Tax=Enterococcus durans TaxID=53345 RepID=UPI0039A59099